MYPPSYAVLFSKSFGITIKCTRHYCEVFRLINRRGSWKDDIRTLWYSTQRENDRNLRLDVCFLFTYLCTIIIYHSCVYWKAIRRQARFSHTHYKYYLNIRMLNIIILFRLIVRLSMQNGLLKHNSKDLGLCSMTVLLK